MYDQQANILKQKVEKLANKAGLKEIPKLKISKKERTAKTSLRKEIIIGVELLSHWQLGEIDENDIEATLAHEVGHIIDLKRGFRSVHFRSNAIALPYIILGAVLPKVASYVPAFEPWILPLFVFIIWAFFLPWILRRSNLAIEFEADKNASRFIIEEQQLANSVVKKSANLGRFYLVKGFGLGETWELLWHNMMYPSLDERLRNINFEIKEIKIQRIKG